VPFDDGVPAISLWLLPETLTRAVYRHHEEAPTEQPTEPEASGHGLRAVASQRHSGRDSLLNLASTLLRPDVSIGLMLMMSRVLMRKFAVFRYLKR
jgi:hypothetical protein